MMARRRGLKILVTRSCFLNRAGLAMPDPIDFEMPVNQTRIQRERVCQFRLLHQLRGKVDEEPVRNRISFPIPQPFESDREIRTCPRPTHSLMEN